MTSDAITSEDVNDAFFDIALAENKFSERGHGQGFAEGLRRGWKTGFDLGVVKGVQVGSEVAFYRGFLTVVKLLVKDEDGSSKRVLKALDSLDSSISTIPSNLTLGDSSTVDTLDIVRAKFKQMCSLLGMSLESTGKPIMEF